MCRINCSRARDAAADVSDAAQGILPVAPTGIGIIGERGRSIAESPGNGLIVGHWLFVAPFRNDTVIDVRYRHDSAGDRDVFAGDAVPIPLAILLLLMGESYLF